MSAFLDDELPEAEAELLLRRLESDAGLRRAAESYLLIGQAMRGELARGAGLRRRVSQALDGEQGHAAVLPRRQPAWLRPVAGVAVAAVVAVGALIGLQNAADNPGQRAMTATATPEEPGYTVPARVVGRGPALGPPSARLTNYMISHGERAGTLARSGMHSRIVTYRIDENSDAADPQSETATDETQQ